MTLFGKDFSLFVNVWHQEVYNSWDKTGNNNGGFKQQYLIKRYEVVIPAGAKDSIVDFSSLPYLEGNIITCLHGQMLMVVAVETLLIRQAGFFLFKSSI